MDRISFYSIIIVAMILALPVLSHFLRERPGVLQWSNLLILGVYLFANLHLTIFSRAATYNYDIVLTPFWSYRDAVTEPFLREEILLNIILYIPLGYLMHYAFPKFKWWQILLCGFGLSLMTEAVQFVFRLGLCEIDDLIDNTLGTFIGLALYQLYIKLVQNSIKRLNKASDIN